MKNTKRYSLSNYLARGFSMIELIMVMIIAGILMAVVFPKMSDTSFAERGFYDGVKTVLRHAQRSAVASRRYVCVNLNSTGSVISLTRDPRLPDQVSSINCTQALNLHVPDKGCSGANQLCAPSGVQLLTSTTLYFDPQGRLVSAPNVVLASTATISMSNQPDISIIPSTGFIQ